MYRVPKRIFLCSTFLLAFGLCGQGDPDHPLRPKIVQIQGTDKKESAIGPALDWLARNQEVDGHWNSQRHGGKGGHDIAATALATLCFFGMGETHLQAGPYQGNIVRALDWLLARQDEAGGFTNQHDKGLYAHGISSLALAEAFGQTKDPKLRKPLDKAVSFILKTQNTAIPQA